MKSPVNNSFREVLRDLLQTHVMFYYLQASEYKSAEGKKQDASMAITSTAETSKSLSCHRACRRELDSAAYVA